MSVISNLLGMYMWSSSGARGMARAESYRIQQNCYKNEMLTGDGSRFTDSTSLGALLLADIVRLGLQSTRRIVALRSLPRPAVVLGVVVAFLIAASLSTLTVAAQTNNAATGQPTISGVLEVGETLNANTHGIADADGLSSVTYSYQWIRVDGSNESDIAQATSSTYTTVGNDIGNSLKVKVTFDDDAGNSEELVSDPTAMVVAFISFEIDEYEVREGESVTVALVASGAPASSVSIPLDLLHDYGDQSYFNINPTIANSLPHFGNGKTRAEFEISAIDDDFYLADKGNFGFFVLKDDFKRPPTSSLPKGFLLRDGENKDVKVIIAYVDIVEDELDPDANDPATGQPNIAGTAQVGEILTAEIGTIADAQEVPSESTFEYQWILVDGSVETEITGATSQTYTVASSDEGKSLKVQVSFSDVVGYEETATSNATMLVLPEIPGAPQNLTARTGDTKVRLSWDAPISGGAPSGYEYRSSSDDKTTWTDWTDTGTDVTTTVFNVTGLVNGTGYVFQIRAINSGGVGPESNEATATPAVPNAPGAPQNLTATPEDQEVKLEWDAPNSGGPADSYQYRQSEDDGSTWSEWEQITGSDEYTTEHTVEGLTNDQAYLFQVRAVNTGGDGASSDSVESTPFLPNPPGPPLNLTATAGDTKVTLEWDAPTSGGEPESYEYRHKKTGEPDYSEWMPIVGSDNTTTSYVVTGLENNVMYTFELRAVNRGGQGSGSSEFPSATPLPPIPGKPVGLTAAAGDTQVTLNWTSPTDGGPVDGYAYRQSEDEGNTWGPWHNMTASDANTTDFAVTGLTNGKTYTFEIIAHNDGGDSDLSDQASARPVPPLPNAPSNLTATAGEAEVVLNWEAPSTGGPIDGYQYRQSTDGGSTWSNWTGATNGDTSFTATPLSFEQQYTFEVRSANLAGESDASNQATATPLKPILRVEIDDASDATSTIHNGSRTQPTVVINFSETVAAFDQNTPSIEITNGYLITAYENTDTTETNDWVLRILPLRDKDVSIEFVVDESCDDGGICTSDGDTLLGVPQSPYVIAFDAKPEIIGGWITGVPSKGFAYDEGDRLTGRIRFSTEVFVADGSPTLDIWIGDQLRTAHWYGGNGTRELQFRYAMRYTDTQTLDKSVTVAQNGLSLAGSTIRSAQGSDADLSFKLAPYVTGVTVLQEESGDGVWTHDANETISVTVDFSETVTVDETHGTPTIDLWIDGREHQVSYASGSGNETLTFEHEVTSTDGGFANGTVNVASIASESLSLNGATIVDASGNHADLLHGGYGSVWRLAPRFGLVSFISYVTHDETVGEAEIVINLDEPNANHVTINYQTEDGTATAGEDYEATSGSVTFAPGETSKTIKIKIFDDSTAEIQEQVRLTLTKGYWAILNGTAIAIFINDDD